MDVCNTVENCKMEGGIINSVNDKCFPTDDFIFSSDNVNHIEINNSGESATDCVLGIDTNACYPINDVPSHFTANEVDAITKSECRQYADCEERTYIVPDSPPNSLFSKVDTSFNSVPEDVNNFDSGICEDSDSRCDVLSSVDGNAEEVLPDITENCKSVEQSSFVNIACGRKPFSKGNVKLSGTALTNALSMKTPGDALSIKKEEEIVDNDRRCEISDVLESNRFETQDIQFINLRNKSPEVSIEDPRRKSHVIVGNNSDIVCTDEMEENCKSKIVEDQMCIDETVVSVRKDNQCQQYLNCRSVSGRKTLNSVSEVGNPVLYQCINCSFTDAQLENVSTHVLTCPKKRRREESHNGEPPSKTRVLEQQHLVLQKSDFTSASKTQSVVLSHNRGPVKPKTHLIISPQSQFVTSPQLRIATTAKTQVNSLKPAQFVLSSPTQETPTNKTVFAIAPKLVSTSKNQVIINPQTQRHVSSQLQVSRQKQQNLALRPQISISPQTQFSSPLRAQPVITLQTQLPFVSSAQLSSVSQPQIVTSSQIPLANGTKVTLGPHSQVPVMPQAPLSLPQQGVTIAQAGTQLLITTKPIQQNASTPNQPTLLGLGIGTNPAIAPKNIVLLPNVLLNSIAPLAGNVNGKQAPTIQRQLILRTTPATASSVAPVQLQKAPQTQKNQSRVLMAPLFTVCGNPVSASDAKTTVSSTEQKSKLPLLSSTPNCTSSTKTTLTSTTNAKTVEASNQMNMSLDKFICEICDDSVKDLEKLRTHMKCLHEINIHPKVVPSFNCQKCQFSFFTEQGLERHLVGSHGLVTPGLQEAADKGKDGGRCPICGWGYQNKLLDHVATDHKVSLKPADLVYKCTICAASFGVYKRFENHVYSVHHPEMKKFARRTAIK